MADINIDYTKVNDVSQVLRTAVSLRVPQLNSLQGAVSGLLATDGGMWLQKSSPVLSQQYTDFNTSITQAVSNIVSFANQFENIVSQIKAMDEQITKSGS
jgi:hypothetical protein